ncbi:MAG: hypothetical protein R2744_11360 [Bacteroidales bacterium]
MTPKLSSYWLFFVTVVSYKLAANLVDSMKIEVIGKAQQSGRKSNITPMTYREAIKLAFARLDKNFVTSTPKDSLVSGRLNKEISEFVQVLTYGTYRDVQVFRYMIPKRYQ